LPYQKGTKTTERNGVTWVEPAVKIEVGYFEETEGDYFCFPVFKRIVT